MLFYFTHFNLFLFLFAKSVLSEFRSWRESFSRKIYLQSVPQIEPNTRRILSSLLSFFISPLSKLILSQQNYVFFQPRCLNIATRIYSIKSTSVQVIHSRLISLCRLRTMWRGLHLMCHGEQQGSLGESSALPDEQSWKSL